MIVNCSLLVVFMCDSFLSASKVFPQSRHKNIHIDRLCDMVVHSGIQCHLSIFGKSIFDAFDFVSGNILFMLTALGCAIFVGFVLKDDAKKELSPTPNSLFTTIWFNYVKFVVPVIILVIFISNM